MSVSNAARIGVWGRSGSGKSSYVKQALKGRRRLVVFDPMDEYSGEGCKSVHTVAAVRAEMRRNWAGFRIAYVPQAGDEPDLLSELSRLLMWAQTPYKKSGGKVGSLLTLTVEEMNTCFPVAGGAANSKDFANICSRGRHYGIEVFGLSQRIAEVSTRFRGNCTETVALKQKGPRDIKAAADELGIGPAQIAALQPLQYLHEKDGVITPGKITFGRKAANSNRAPKQKRRAA